MIQKADIARIECNWTTYPVSLIIKRLLISMVLPVAVVLCTKTELAQKAVYASNAIFNHVYTCRPT